MSKPKIVSFCLMAVSTAVLMSCGGEEPKGPRYNYERADSLDPAYLQELSSVRTNIEISAQLFGQLVEAEYPFDESLMLSSGKSFSGSKGQALGLGAVGSDLVYATLFGQNQTAITRSKDMMDQANKLNVPEAFDEKFITALTSDDSTINKPIMLTKAYLNAKDQLFSEDRAQLATFMAVGGWVEGIYIGSGALKTKLDRNDIRITFFEMVKSYDNVMKMLTVFADMNPEIAALKTEMEALAPAIGPIKSKPNRYKLEQVVALHEAIGKFRSKILN